MCFLISNYIPKKNIRISKGFNIRLVQPNIKQIDKWDKTKTLINLNKLISLTKNNNEKSIDLVVWPETAVLFDITEKENKNYY